MKSEIAQDYFTKNWEYAIFLSDPFLSLSKLGKKAYAAGEGVRKYLSHDDWDYVLSAAQTLDYIGYRPAIADLVNKLHNSYDVKLTYVALKSLYLLGADKEIVEVERVARNH